MTNKAHGELDVIFVNGAPQLRNRPEPPVELRGFRGFCGCGKPVTYALHTGNLACNKYSRCWQTNAGRQAMEKSNKAMNRIAQIMYDDDKSTDEGLDFALDQISEAIDGLS